ncbi:hypothetical protein U3516DRAFT_738179 [Neocallimastix sp. 'constans']
MAICRTAKLQRIKKRQLISDKLYIGCIRIQQSAPMPYHFGVDALNTLTNEDLQYAGITPLQAIVDDDLFDLGLGCQMDYNGVYALTIDPISRSFYLFDTGCH